MASTQLKLVAAVAIMIIAVGTYVYQAFAASF